MGQDIILCQITSQKTRKDRYCVELKRNATLDGTLKLDSYIRANMIFTAHKSQIYKIICSVKDDDYHKVIRIIQELISR